MPALAVLLLRRASLARERARAVKARGRAGRGASRARREQGAARAAHLFDVNEQHLPVTDRDGQDVLDAVEGQLLAHLHHRVPRRPVLRTTVQRPSAERVRARARGPVPAGAARGGRGSARARARPPTHASPGHPHTPAPMPPACPARAASSHAVLRAPGSGAPRGCRRRRARPRTRGGSAPRCATAGQRTARWRCSRSHSAHHGCALLPADPAATVGPKLQQRFVFELFQVRASRPRTLVRLEV